MEMKTFASMLEHFTLSVDLIDEDNFGDIMRLIHEFTNAALGVQSVSVLIATPELKGGEGLVREDGKLLLPIKRNNQYTDVRALSYDQQIPLWVVNESQEPLSQSDDLQDLMSEITNLPPYTDPPNLAGKIKLSVVIPLKISHAKVFGVISFDSDKYEAMTEMAKKELKMVADSVSKLYRIREYYKNQHIRTNKAIKQLKSRTFEEKLSEFLKKPHIFLASSGAANDDVIATIKEVIDEYSDKIDLVYWKDINKLGNINEQILKAISGCKYGICYFSEDVGQDTFSDNYNVTFEAGMLQALTNAKVDNAPEAWIPIREEISGEIPFDFAAERFIHIPRDSQNKLILESFRNQLRERINEL
jgi:hypothetical protein